MQTGGWWWVQIQYSSGTIIRTVRVLSNGGGGLAKQLNHVNKNAAKKVNLFSGPQHHDRIQTPRCWQKILCRLVWVSWFLILMHNQKIPRQKLMAPSSYLIINGPHIISLFLCPNLGLSSPHFSRMCQLCRSYRPFWKHLDERLKMLRGRRTSGWYQCPVLEVLLKLFIDLSAEQIGETAWPWFQSCDRVFWLHYNFFVLVCFTLIRSSKESMILPSQGMPTPSDSRWPRWTSSTMTWRGCKGKLTLTHSFAFNMYELHTRNMCKHVQTMS